MGLLLLDMPDEQPAQAWAPPLYLQGSQGALLLRRAQSWAPPPMFPALPVLTPVPLDPSFRAARAAGDIRLEWANGTIDAVIEGDDVAAEAGLRTALLLSLFTDRRAEADDALPSEDGDRRGWWGDGFAAVEGDLFGSRLWLLDRSARRHDVVARAKEYVAEALRWMVEDHVTESLGIEVEAQDDRLLIAITVARPGMSPVTFRFQHVWDGELARGS